MLALIGADKGRENVELVTVVGADVGTPEAFYFLDGGMEIVVVSNGPMLMAACSNVRPVNRLDFESWRVSATA